jgi:dihydrofolate synthase/folylpolyglutamate synthase
MLSNKDIEGFFAPFAPLKPRVIGISFEGNAATAERIVTAARTAGLDAQVCEAGVEYALGAALSNGAPHVVICGSLHLAGEVLGLAEETWPV